jgi:hypothetical protein
MAEKIFCGSAKIKTTTFGDITKLSLNKDDVAKIVDYMATNTTDWVNIDVVPKRSPEQGKPTHYLAIDDWKPDGKFKPEQSVPVDKKVTDGSDFELGDN